ncbi:MAG: hypothetical protein IT537_04260 [Hyphomicrobiales bacterium]|nr:hypothetical protein [Hyphomicrobiales bacterium]
MPRIEDWTEGITDSQSLQDAIAFARRWHRREWAITALPRDLGLQVSVRDVGADALGACIVIGGRRAISLSRTVLGTRGYVPALAHECGHLFQPSGMGLCRSTVQMGRREREAWWIASVLAVPLEMVRGVSLFNEQASIVAHQLELPRPMVTMRTGVALCLGEIVSRESRFARPMLELGTMAMQIWIHRFSQQLAELG